MEGDRIAPRIASEQGRRSAVGPKEAEQDADRCRLSRTVRAQESVDLTGRDRELEAVEGAGRTERLYELVYLD
jgi:hypothetical protein